MRIIGDRITEIGSGFLMGFKEVTDLDLSKLKNITKVGAGFVADCSSLITLDLSPLKKC